MRHLKASSRVRACAAMLLLCAVSTLAPAAALAVVATSQGRGAGARQSHEVAATSPPSSSDGSAAGRPGAGAGASRPGTLPAVVTSLGTASLESVATKASETGRNIAVSLIGLALAVAAIVLAFKRDFRQATAVFAVGLVCVLMASSAGETLLQDTVKTLVGA